MPNMTQCKTCGQDVAANAKACPNCGADLQAKTRMIGGFVGLGLGVLFVVWFVLKSKGIL